MSGPLLCSSSTWSQSEIDMIRQGVSYIQVLVWFLAWKEESVSMGDYPSLDSLTSKDSRGNPAWDDDSQGCHRVMKPDVVMPIINCDT